MGDGLMDRRTGGRAEVPGVARPVGTVETLVRPSDRPTVLVVQTAFLGDVVLTTPLLSVLAERFGPVDVVTTPAAAGLLDHHPAVDSVLRYDKHGADRGWKAFRRLGAQLRTRRYERVYLPHRSLRSALLALWSRAKHRVGFADGAGAFSYTSRVVRPREGHEVERLLALAGLSPGENAPPVSLGLAPTDLAAADAWLLSHGVGGDFVAIAPGSVWATKRWPYYAELAAELELTSVIVGGAEDAPLAEAMVKAAGGRAISAAGAFNLRGSAGIDPARGGTGDERLRAAPPGYGGRNSDRRDLWTHGTGVRVRPPPARRHCARP